MISNSDDHAGSEKVINLSSLLFLLVFILVFTLYFATLAPGVVGGDAGEHELAVPLLGIPHTTGYPLYILVGNLWTILIPIGSMAWRVNLFSALGGALAAGTTAVVVSRLSETTFHQKNLWAGALAAGVALSFGLTLWQWSVIAGVRSFNVFFFALLTLQAITFAQQHRADRSKAARRTLRWLALTVGLSLTHHRTTLFYLPSLIAWIWWHDRALIRQPRRLLTLAALTLVPLTLYAFVYLRGVTDPPYTHEQITDLESFWFLVGSGDSTGLFLSIDPTYIPARLNFIGQDILAQLSLPGVLLSALGAIILLRRYPGQFLFQALLVLLLLLFTLDFEVVNLNEAPTWYLMPAYFIFTVWLGIGVNGIVLFLERALPVQVARDDAQDDSIRERRLASVFTSRSGVVQIMTTALCGAILSYTLGWPNWQQQYTAAAAPLDDWRQLLRGTQAQRFVESSLPHVEPNSIIWGDWEQYTPFKYYQLVQGVRPDVTVRNPLDRWPEKVAAARAQNQPVYFTRKPADLIGTPYLSMVGPLIHLQKEPNFEAPADVTPVNANFEDELMLIGYQARVVPQRAAQAVPADSILQITLYWRALQKLEWDYALSLRLIDALGQEVHKTDAAHPVLSSYPTTLWTAGEVVADHYELPLRSETGPLTLHVLPYRTEGQGVWRNLTVVGVEPPQEGVFLGPF